MKSTRDVQLTGKRVLLVDDNEINREITVQMLEAEQLRVISAIHGMDAISKLRTDRFDVVLMDCEMPVMDGFAATRAIRARQDLDELPVIAFTSNSTAFARSQAFEAGMNDFILKPTDRTSLIGVIKRWL